MKALVTGGSGFLGRYIVKELERGGIDTVVYDIVPPRGNGLNGDLPENSTFVKGDILDSKTLQNAMEGCDIVFHTAAIADIDETRKKPVETVNVNILGTAVCLEAARNADVDRFMFASTVYTGGNRGSFYRLSKQAGESACKTYHEEFGLNYTILKYGSLYGRDANHWNFMYTVCMSLLKEKNFVYQNSPDAVRAFIHIFDAARETVRISGIKEYENRTVLITGSQSIKMKDLFDTIEEIMENNVSVLYQEDEKQRHYIRTPYTFDPDVPVRLNPETYIDIHEGVLDCLNEVWKKIHDGESYE